KEAAMSKALLRGNVCDRVRSTGGRTAIAANTAADGANPGTHLPPSSKISTATVADVLVTTSASCNRRPCAAERCRPGGPAGAISGAVEGGTAAVRKAVFTYSRRISRSGQPVVLSIDREFGKRKFYKSGYP